MESLIWLQRSSSYTLVKSTEANANIWLVALFLLLAVCTSGCSWRRSLSIAVFQQWADRMFNFCVVGHCQFQCFCTALTMRGDSNSCRGWLVLEQHAKHNAHVSASRLPYDFLTSCTTKVHLIFHIVIMKVHISPRLRTNRFYPS